MGLSHFLKSMRSSWRKLYPDGQPVSNMNGVDLWYYNDGTGLLELNLMRLVYKSIVSLPGASINFNHIAYTEIYYYPNNQVTSKIFYLPVIKPKEHDDGTPVTVDEFRKAYEMIYNQSYRDEVLLWELTSWMILCSERSQ